jgi:glycosyltransferase involved in cell wall biosynthesis
MNGHPNVLIICQNFPSDYNPKTTPNINEGFAENFNLHFLSDLDRLNEVLANNKIDLIVVDKQVCTELDLSSEYKWKILYIDPIELIHLLDGDYLFEQHIRGMMKNAEDLISVFTPTYNTDEMIYETYQCLVNQSHKSWEWVIIDDSTDDITYRMLSEISSRDYRVKVYKQSKRSGVIGHLKNKAASLCDGYILVELDHDDMLTVDALEVIKNAFDTNLEAGYLYSDSVEFFTDMTSRTYGEGFGMGCGTYYDFEYANRTHTACAVPINSKTLRHNVGLPNHVRAWRKSFYQEIGGHNVDFNVVDDHEMSVRCFLNTQIIHVNSVLYFQRVREGGQNTTNTRNSEIQRTSRGMFNYYDKKIHERIESLGLEDHVWDRLNNKSDLSRPIDIKEDYSISYNK